MKTNFQNLGLFENLKYIPAEQLGLLGNFSASTKESKRPVSDRQRLGELKKGFHH